MNLHCKQLLVLFGILLLSSPCLFSQGPAASSLISDSSAVKESFNLDERKKGVKLFLDKIDILGRIDKPQAVFIVQGQDPDVDDIQIDRSFFREIFRSIERDGIRKVASSIRKIDVKK